MAWDAGAADSLGYTALHWTVVDSRVADFVEPLIHKGAPLNAPAGANHVTPLLGAIESKNAAAAEQLLRAGADPNLAMARGITPLMGAALLGQVSVARLLVEKGARIDAVADTKLTPLKAAVSVTRRKSRRC